MVGNLKLPTLGIPPALAEGGCQILVDAPPSLGLLTDNALLACRNLLIPALAEATSQHALDILFDHMETLEEGYGVEIDPVGIVINRIEVDGEADRMLE